MQFVVNAKGRVQDIVFLNDSLSSVFKREIRKTLRKWRFERPADEQVVVRKFSFDLSRLDTRPYLTGSKMTRSR